MKARPPRLSQPALETLAIIAYRQPITRAEVEQIRGVNVDGTMQTLTERGLVEQVGRAEVVGRPPTYGTTALFLEYFGLRGLEDLPAADELRRIVIEKPPAPRHGGSRSGDGAAGAASTPSEDGENRRRNRGNQQAEAPLKPELVNATLAFLCRDWDQPLVSAIYHPVQIFQRYLSNQCLGSASALPQHRIRPVRPEFPKQRRNTFSTRDRFDIGRDLISPTG